MKITIIADDGFVSQDGVGYTGLALNLDANIHAVQWYDTYGEIEYKPVFDGVAVSKAPNKLITDMTAFDTAMAEWAKADALVKAAALAALVTDQPKPAV